jgi:ligand-binding sensor domain-containing protein
MSRHSIGRISCPFLMLCSLSCWVSADNYGSTVAGHQILRTYNQEKNSRMIDGNARVIFEDRAGRFWIAASSGIHMYDEKQNEWVSFTKEIAELGGASVMWIGQSNDDKLWFAERRLSLGSGSTLTCFDGHTWRRPDAASKDSTVADPVTAMFPGQHGKLWIAVKDQLRVHDGMQWKPQAKLSEAIEDDSAVTVRVGLQDSEGCIWLGTSHGIIRFDERKNEWGICDPFATSNSASVNNVYAREMRKRGVTIAYEDRRRRIWFIDVEGDVMIWDKGKAIWTFYKLSDHMPLGKPEGAHVYANAIYQDSMGQIMFATSHGLLTFNETENTWRLFTPENSGLPSTLITSIYEDRDGRIWIGTGKGIVVLGRESLNIRR